jgi:hypothetical protein
LLLVWVEAGSIGADCREQDAAAAGRLPRLGRSAHCSDEERERYDGEQRSVTSDPCGHLTPPSTWNVDISISGPLGRVGGRYQA